MTCAEVRDLLDLHACGALEGAERDAVAAHLRTGCPGCAGALAERETALHHLAMALPPVEPPAGLKRAILDRVAQDAARGQERTRVPSRQDLPSGSPVPVRPAPRRFVWAPVLSAAAAIVVTVLAMRVPARRERAILEEQVAARDREIARLADQVRSAEQAAEYLRSGVLYTMAGTGSQPQAAARVYWDPGRGRARLVASRLQPSAAGRTYELWLIEGGAAGRKVPAGTFDVGADGSGTLDLAIPADLQGLAVLAVTDEPSGGSAQPTGSIHLAGEVAAKS